MGTPAYIAPEVLSRKAYDGKAADVWSCGVTLYVMVVGGYPFEDPADARNFRKTIMRIRGVQYAFPAALNLSEECKDLVKRIFVLDPVHRLNIAGIKQHPWFQRNLPAELQNAVVNNPGHQSVVIRADKRVMLDYAVQVMNLCNKSGISDYVLTTQGPDG